MSKGRRKIPVNEKQADRLKEVRKAAKLSQAQLAEIAACEQQNISKYERLIIGLPTDVAERIGAHFGVRPAWLLGLDDWKTWNDLPEEIISDLINRAWDSVEKSEELLEAVGYRFVLSDKVKQLLVRYTDEDGEHECMVDDRNDPMAFHVFKDGFDKGFCSMNEKSQLLDSISDFAEYQAERLISKAEKRGVENG